MHPNTAQLLEFFDHSHLPEHLAKVSARFHDLAHWIADNLDGAEATAGLRKLLEAKDCAVRAAIVAARRAPAEAPR
jgi:hypothetical protein